jgi:hypothetical protein
MLDEAGSRLSKGDFSGTLTGLSGLGSDPALSAADERRAKELARAAKAGLEKAKAGQIPRKAAPVAGESGKTKGRAVCDKVFAQAESRRAAGEHAAAIRDYQEVVTGCPDYCTASQQHRRLAFQPGLRPGIPAVVRGGPQCDPGEKLFTDNVALTKRLTAQKTEAGRTNPGAPKSLKMRKNVAARVIWPGPCASTARLWSNAPGIARPTTTSDWP